MSWCAARLLPERKAEGSNPFGRSSTMTDWELRAKA